MHDGETIKINRYYAARAKVQYARYFKGEIGEPTHRARINDRALAKIRSEYVVAG